MVVREAVAAPSVTRDLSLKSAPNWTAIVFFACLSFAHFGICLPAFYHRRWEGYLSLLLALFFATSAVVSYFVRYELIILPRDRCIRVRQGVGPFNVSRFIPFSDIHAVRLTLIPGKRHTESRIEVLCDNQDIECPPTAIPRQQALFLAVTMGVELIKVSDGEPEEESDRAF